MNKELKEVINYYKSDNEKYEKSMLTQFNKEQLETTFHKSYQKYKNHKVLLDYIIELQDRIDKAIEHIEKHQLVFQSQYEEMSGFDNHLLDILKGSDNNDK